MKKLVDLHSHILPGLDDGPDNLAESLEMLEVMEALGYGHVFATPHQRLYSWEEIRPEVVEEGVEEMTAAAEERGIRIRILPGMEYDLDETLPERSISVPGGGGHILVDAGFQGVPLSLKKWMEKLMDSGKTVMLVHPERNGELCKVRNGLCDLVDSGVKLLGNLGSFSGMYGRKVRRDARRLLKSSLYWAVASDMHSADQSGWIKEGMVELRAIAGISESFELMVGRPMRVIEAMENSI